MSVSGITFNDLLKDPGKYGAPTLGQFLRNKYKYDLNDIQSIMERAESGGVLLKKHLKKLKWEICGYRCDSPEKVEQVAKDMGIKLRNEDWTVELIPLGGGTDCEAVVKFMSRAEKERRDAWR